jgi:hypothetical protein
MKRITLRKNGGFAAVYGIVILLVASIAGVSLITISQKDNIASIDQVKMRTAAVSAEAALIAVEQQCESQPQVFVDIINNFVSAGSNTTGKGWLLSSANNWLQENKISLDPTVSNPPQYSARILSFDNTNKILLVEGYGYGGGGGGGKKKALGIYKLSGLGQAASYSKYALYMNGEAQNFDKPVNITGNVYFDSVVTSNGTGASVFNGTFQAMSTTATVRFQSAFTFNEPALFMGPTVSSGILTFNKKAGFNRVVTLNSGPMQAKADLYFNNSVSGNSATNVFNMNGNVAHTTTTNPVSSSRITNGTIVQDGASIDVASKVSLSSAAQAPFQFDISGIPSSVIKSVSGNINAATIQTLYNSSTLWKGYLVIKPAAYTAIQVSGTNTVTCNTIWIIENMMFANQGWFISGPNTITVLYCRSQANVQSFGSNGLFRGYLYATDNAFIYYAWQTGNSFVGAVHHTSATNQFQMNSSTGTWNLTWSDAVMDQLISDGLVKVPGGGTPTGQLTLSDFNLKTKMLGKYF